MANDYFKFKQFVIKQDRAAFKVTTDSVLLGSWAELGNAGKILDIGTGTGILALMAAQRSEAFITAIEPDGESFDQASFNISESPWAERINVIRSSLQDFTVKSSDRFNAIISNPPYFTASLLNPDYRKAMARHTENLPTGELLRNSVRLLTEYGSLHVVLPEPVADSFIREAQCHGLWCQRILNVHPLPGKPAKRVLMTLGREKITTEVQSLVIETGARHHYSDEYLRLTHDFYLDK